MFIEGRKSFAQHLCSEIQALPDLGGATVEVIHGEYENAFPIAVEALALRYRAAPLPTFAFVDPLGYEKTPFTLIRDYRARLGKAAEAMIYLPTGFMGRFVGTDITEQALDRAFGSREAWARVRDKAEPGGEASALLADAYADLLRTQYELVSRFAVDPTSRNRYYLFFGTGHIDGLKAMKAAYWKVDPEDGRGYRQDILTAGGQGELFAPVVEAPNQPEEDLAALVADEFANREFTIEDAELFALTSTGFRETHVRKLALEPLEAAGHLVVDRRGSKGFPAGTKMRFRLSVD